MTSAIKRQNTPPPLPRAAKREQFPDVNIHVLHARVIEAFEAKIPITRGGGCTIRGYGTSWVDTAVRDELSVWLRDHQTGAQHKMDFGADFLPMRMGHDVTLLWANGQLVTIANHTTGQLRHPTLRKPILNEMPIIGGVLYHCLLILGLGTLMGALLMVSVPYLLASLHGLRPEQVRHYVDVVTANLSRHPAVHDPVWRGITMMAWLILSVGPSALMMVGNGRRRTFNARQQTYLNDQLRAAEERWIRQYTPPRAVTW